jgi:chromosome segregation ATPase
LSLEKQLGIANKEVERCQRLITEKNEEIDQITSGNSDVSELQRKHKVEVESWRKKLKDKDKERDEWIEERNSFLLQIQDLKTKLSNANKEDLGRTEELMNEVHFYQTEITNQKNKIGEYEGILDELGKLNEFLALQAKENEARIKELESKNNFLTIRITEFEGATGDVEEARAKARKAENEAKRLQDDLDKSSKTIKSLSLQIESMEQDLAECKSKMDKAIRDKNKAVDDVDELKMKIDMLEKKIGFKDDELTKLNQKINSLKNE